MKEPYDSSGEDRGMAKAAEMKCVRLSDILDAFLFVSSAAHGEHAAFINTETGQLYYRSELGDTDEVPTDVESDLFLEIPHKNDLDLGTQLVYEFASEKLPDEYDKVRGMFTGSGAYGRFKDFLATKGLLEAWYTFEDEREKEALRLWCDENGLKLVDEHAGM